MNGSFTRLWAVTALVLTAGCGLGLQADIVTINMSDSGWYGRSGNHTPTNRNYFAGNILNSQDFRNFFVFDFTSPIGPVVSGNLFVTNRQPGGSQVAKSPDPSETYEIFEVTSWVTGRCTAPGPGILTPWRTVPS